MRSIELPPTLAYRVRKIAEALKISPTQAIDFLVREVCTPPKKFAAVGVHTYRGRQNGED